MHTYIYTDNSKYHFPQPQPVIFTCEASGILEADALFEEKFPKVKLVKAAHIGCQIIFGKPAYQFTCEACKTTIPNPGWCHTCQAEANAYYDELQAKLEAETPEPAVELAKTHATGL